MQPLELGLTGLAVFLGSVSQRVTGLGFTLVAAPVLVLVMGPFNGVTLCLVLNAVLAAAVLCRTWRYVLWERAVQLFLGSLAGTVIGAQLVALMTAPALMVAVGLLIMLAVGLVLSGVRLRSLQGRRGALLTGLLSGGMNVTAGTGGPILAAHSVADGWAFMTFVGTVQVYFLGSNILALVMRGSAELSPAVWVSSAVALLAGATTGHFLSRAVPEKRAMRLVTGFSLAGGAATLLRGLFG
ncbi:sulfite exporter TauE/SafE family protein [Arthrobacter mangrovi]|uniref:Probable membrane transporter protein n=1 Tax=Arthrobacter mangrovi TaxID=2966350 RepID=A0ABQ5MYX6_9MICC|nr:sulfite exporter TauE/SafE family protein [Arthrobacter mangrovi]GLB69168.1 hypothetical protein AHIS1636_36110 [Arthrobacter mangrovi]